MNKQIRVQAYHIPQTNLLIEEGEDEPPSSHPLLNQQLQSFILDSCHNKQNDCLPIPPITYQPIVKPQQSNARLFRRTFYPNTTTTEWNDWRWQISNRIRSFERLDRMLNLSFEEKGAFFVNGPRLPVGITPYYMSLINRDNPLDALRRTVVPSMDEFKTGSGESADPLSEEGQSPIPGLVHRYPDRVLLLVTNFCSTYCRYCTRSRMVGNGHDLPSKSRIEKAIAYIRETTAIRDVLISGGDPLTLSDTRLEWIIQQLRQIPHIEIIRIGTKIPVVLPQRITSKLVKMLRRYHPLFMSIHFTHPDEFTPEVTKACNRLADAGIPLGSQTVLLKDVNDQLSVLRSLMHNLMKVRVRPYYLYQCDPILGSSHFRTPVSKGLEIINGLRGFTSGYAVPTYVIDAPGGGGKIPLMPEYKVMHNGEEVILRNYEGKLFQYPDMTCQNEKPIIV